MTQLLSKVNNPVKMFLYLYYIIIELMKNFLQPQTHIGSVTVVMLPLSAAYKLIYSMSKSKLKYFTLEHMQKNPKLKCCVYLRELCV